MAEIATDALTEILIHIQQQVIANLEAQETQDGFIELAALQDVSDSSQDRCVLVLMQLQQRIITSGPIENVTPPPLNPSSVLNRSLPAIPAEEDDDGSTIHARSPPPPKVFLSPENPDSSKPLTPPHSPRPPINAVPRTGSQLSGRSTSGEHFLNDMRAPGQNQYRPMATTVTKAGFFGFGKRTKVEPVVEPPENPLVDEYLATAILDEYRGMDHGSRTGSISTTQSSLLGSSILEPDPPNMSHSPDRGASPTVGQSPIRSESRLRGSLESWGRSNSTHNTDLEVLTSNRSLNSINPRDLLPSEMNQYGGFCKGAWRQQIGDKKRAMEERVRPGGMYNAARYWQCKQCKFEGRLVAIDKKTSRYDLRVFRLVDGIQFRWEFMFKSHLHQHNPTPDPTKSSFGCIFCCAEGRGTPTFDGLTPFMMHLIEHRDPLPTGEVLYRMNCLVGRQAGMDEDFDINFVSRDGGLI